MAKNTYPTEVLQVQIQDLNDKGQGMAVYYHPVDQAGQLARKLRLTIPFAYPGDVVQVTVPNAKGRRRATVNYDSILSPSPDRTGQAAQGQVPEAGAPLRYMDYSAQLAYKEKKVCDLFRQGGFDPQAVKPILGMDNPYHYRNKMELTFGKAGAIGMHQAGNFRVINDWQDNVLAPEIMMTVKETVASWQQAHHLSTYDKESRQGLLRHLMMRQSFATQELMVAVFATESSDAYTQAAKDLVQRLQAACPQLASLLWIENTDIADRTQAQAVTVLAGRDFIYDQLAGFRYRIWFDTFFQPNPQQAEKMVETALNLAQIDADMRVMDLFCGVGTFSLPLAQAAKELAGIEIVDSSIQSARRNAADNGIDNTYFLTADARSGMKTVEAEWGQPDLVLLDPPRSGAGGKVMRRIGRLGTDKIIYVSCNPVTLVQDLQWLKDFGYELVSCQPIDQFPQTVHVECIVLIEKVKE